jgi:GMP synthase (glutamine-hydrolysing)
VAATITRERLELARRADAVVMTALERHGLLRHIWQCPTVLLPLRLDGRGCEVVVLRPVLSERAMTARPAELPLALVEQIRAPLLALPGVCGLLLDLSTKPPGTIEWE